MKIKGVGSIDSSYNPVSEQIATTLAELQTLDKFTLLNRYPDVYDPIRLPRVEMMLWADVLNQIDSLLAKQIELDQDKRDINQIIQLLQLSEVIIANTSNSSIYKSVERLSALITSDSLSILDSVLRVLAEFVLSNDKSHRFSADKIAIKNMTDHLIPLLNLWGGKSCGFSLCSLLSGSNNLDNETGSTLNFQFFSELTKSKQTIHITKVYENEKSPRELTDSLIAEYKVPEQFHFPLLHCVRLAHGFYDLETRRQLVHIQLNAFSVCSAFNLSSASPHNYAEELTELINSPDPTIPSISKTFAVNVCLSVMKSSSNSRFVSILRSDCNSAEGMIPSAVKEAVSVASSDEFAPLFSRTLVLALMRLTISYASSNFRILTSSRNPITPGPFLGLLTYKDLDNAPLALSACQIFTFWFETSQTAFQTFADSNGVNLVINACKTETQNVLNWFNDKCKSNPKFCELLIPSTVTARNSSENSDPISIYHALLQEFLVLLLSTFHSPWRSMGNGVVGQLIQEGLHEILISILSDWVCFGPRIYRLAIRLVAEFIQTEPSSYGLIFETGLISVTLDSLIRSDCPYDSALGAICNVLSAICLTKDGIKEVQSKNVINTILGVLGDEDLAPAIKPRICTILGSGLNELVKHHPELKEETLKTCLQIIQDVQSSKEFRPGGYSAIKRNISTFLESFFAGGFDFGLDTKVTEQWVDVLLAMYSNSFGTHSNHGPSRSHSCVIALLGISNNHLGLILRRVFEMIGNEIETLNDCDFGYDDDTSKILCKLDNLISLLVRLAKPTDYQQQSSLQELGTLQSLIVFQSMGEIHRTLLWELSKLELDAMEKLEAPTRDRRRNRIGSSDLAPRSPLMRMRERYHARLRHAELDREAGAEESSNIFERGFGQPGSLFARPEGLPNPPAIPQQQNRIKNTIREKLLDLTDFINQLSLSLLGAAGFLGDPEPLVKALAQILKGHFTWLTSKTQEEQEKEGEKQKSSRFVPVLYLGGMLRGLNTLLTCDIEASCALLLRSFQEENGIVEVIKQCNHHLLNPRVVKTLNSETNKWGSNQQVHSVYPQLTQFMRHIISPRLKQQFLAISSSSFEPKQFLENLYCMILRVFLPLWKQKALQNLPHDFISDLFSLCATFLQGPETFLKDLAPKEPVVADPNLVQQLQVMGFPQNVCEDVLRRVENDFDAALERLLNGFVMEEAAANLIVESQPESEEQDFDEDDELAMALAMSMGQAPSSQTEKKEEGEEEVKPEETIASLLAKLNENLLEDCMRLLYVPDVATPLSQFLTKYGQNNEEKSGAVVSVLCSCLQIEESADTSSLDSVEYLYNGIFTMTLLGLKTAYFRNAITTNEANKIILSLMENSLPDSTTATFDPPKWFVTGLLCLGGQCQIPAEYTEESPAIVLCAMSLDEQDRAMKLCITLLKHQLDSSITHALLQLISYLTKTQEQAEFFTTNKGIDLLFNLQQKSFFSSISSIIVHILRHSIEDIPTLQTTMEAEITFFLKHFIPENETKITPKAFVALFSHLIQREPSVFMAAATNLCQIASFSPDSLAVTRITAEQSPKQDESSQSTPSRGLKSSRKNKSNVYVTRTKSSRKISEGLLKVVPMVAQGLIDLVDYQVDKELNDEEGPALKIVHLVSFLRDFCETYATCASFIIKKPQFTEQISVDNFIKYLLEKVLPQPSQLSEEKSSASTSDQVHHVSGLFVALWSKPDCRRTLLGEISSTLTNLLCQAKEIEEKLSESLEVCDSAVISIEQLSILVGLADLIHSLLSATLAPGSEQQCKSELPDLILESHVITQLVDSLDLIDLDRKEASRVLFHLLPALESSLKLVTIFSGSKSSNDPTDLKDSAQIIRDHLRVSDAFDGPASSGLNWENVQEINRELETDSDSASDETDTDEEDEEDYDMEGDDNIFDVDNNPFLSGLSLDNNLGEIEQLLPFLHRGEGRSPQVHVYTGDSLRGGNMGPGSFSRFREEPVSVEHPLLAPVRGAESSHRSRMLESIFNNAEYSFRHPGNNATNPMQILRSLGVSLPSSLVMRVNRWLDSGSITSGNIAYGVSFENQLIEQLLSDEARAQRDQPKSNQESKSEVSIPSEASNVSTEQPSTLEQVPAAEQSSPEVPVSNEIDSSASDQLMSFLSSAGGLLSGNPQVPANQDSPSADVAQELVADENTSTTPNTSDTPETSASASTNSLEQQSSQLLEFLTSATSLLNQPSVPPSTGQALPSQSNPEESSPTGPVASPSSVPSNSNNEPGTEEQVNESSNEAAVEQNEPPAIEAQQRQAIDMDVLAELPPEIREEILANQQAIETAMNSGSVPEVNQEFLEGLPIAMQAEVLEQARAGSSAPGSGISSEMDMGTFLATLSDELREEILLTMDETMLNSLPGHFIAEVQTIRDRSRSRFHGGGFERFLNQAGGGSGSRVQRTDNPRPVQFRDYEGSPLLSESSLIPLLRILYLTDSTASAALPKLFHSICKHATTRKQLLSFLLYILSASKSSSCIEPIVETSDRFFSPLCFPCHGLIGFQGEGKDLYSYSSTSGQFPPQTVLRRILYVVDYLAKKIPKVFEFMFAPMDYSLVSLLPCGSITFDDCPLPVCNLFVLLSKPQIIESAQTLESFVNFLRLVFAPLHEFKVISDDANNNEDNVLNQQEPEVEPEPEPEAENESDTHAERSVKSEAAEDDDEPRICPVLPINYLCHLPRVFTLKTCTEKTYKATMSILRRVCANEVNRTTLLSELQNTAISLAQNLTEQLSEVEFDVSSGSLVIKQQNVPQTPQGLSFLRLLRLIVALDSASVQNDFAELWKHLDSCMASATTLLTEQESLILSDTSSFSVLLPVIEAFFVVHGKQNENNSDDSGASRPVLVATRTKSEVSDSTLSVSESNLYEFVRRYKTILNLLIKQSPELLNSGSFSEMIQFPFLLDFDVKRSYFRSKLHETENHRFGGLRLNVRRDRLFEDSYHQIKGRTADELKGRLTIQFAGEPGIDAGGLLKDWYQELSRSIFNPGYALFIQSADSAFQPNKDSRVNAHHLDFFNFCGRVIGKAIYDGANMDVHFTRSFYKHMLGKRVVWKDMEAVDPEYYKNLKWMLDNDITDVMDLSFTAEVNSFGVLKAIDLIPNGSSIPVTEENKGRYVQLISEFKMTATIEEQIQAFLKGLYELVPKELISLFNELELELLISGLPDIDIEDMRRNTEYTGYRADSPTIQYFWNIVKRYSQEERALLLQFVTGSSKVPLDGFEALQGMGGPQKFRIVKISGETDRLPSAHTCFNQLDMPEYSTEEDLEHKLTLAIKETTGFGFG